jgi:hypothetical protein
VVVVRRSAQEPELVDDGISRRVAQGKTGWGSSQGCGISGWEGTPSPPPCRQRVPTRRPLASLDSDATSQPPDGGRQSCLNGGCLGLQ